MWRIRTGDGDRLRVVLVTLVVLVRTTCTLPGSKPWSVTPSSSITLSRDVFLTIRLSPKTSTGSDQHEKKKEQHFWGATGKIDTEYFVIKEKTQEYTKCMVVYQQILSCHRCYKFVQRCACLIYQRQQENYGILRMMWHNSLVYIYAICTTENQYTWWNTT